jgi:alkylation response protein AidB-like acyl-CoA dehydrogenase
MGLHFDFSSEQRMLAESMRGLFAREQATGKKSAMSSIAELGRKLAGQGVFGVMMPEDSGGLGLGLTEALVIALETGRAQVRYPVIETIAAAGMLAEARSAIAEGILSGEQIATFAASGDVELVSGAKGTALRGQAVVPFADDARWLVLPVRKSESNDPGLWAAIVDLTAPGISSSAAPEFDLTYPMFRVSFDAPLDPSDVIADRATPLLAVLACGELTGAAEHCFDLTIGHLRERVQFGKPIGVNQSLRHLAADDWIRVQNMNAASEYAAASFDSFEGVATDTESRAAGFALAAHVAKAYCSNAAREVAEHALQMHGGIGFTWEFGLHVPLRRILRLAASYGDVTDHHGTLADALLNENGSSE